MTNQDYKNAALAALKGRWAPAVLATVVIFLLMAPYYAFSFGTQDITAAIQADPIGGAPSWYWWTYAGVLLFFLIVVNPAQVGYNNACKHLLVEGDDRVTANMFKIGFSRWLRNVWGIFLMGLKVFLWALLFIIPGLVKVFGYALTPFLLVDCPDLSPLQCIKLSDRMMKGHKFDLFYLYLSFIGWFLLGLLTLGIGYLWLTPYVETSFASFYLDVKEQYRAQLDPPVQTPTEAPVETPAE
ncbi:MAG: DUF975 family protein [Bacteroidales bacterium]|nr:DUF975 family protein [Bacteroidales bacterium]